MKLQNQYKALIFDFGNVLINIDFDRTFRAFKQLFGKEYELVMQQWKNTNMHVQIESNKITAQDMANEFNRFLNKKVTAKDIQTAWNALLLDLPKERIDLLKKLKEHYGLYLLSNTNYVHIAKIYSNLEHTYGENPLPQIFDDLFLSYEIGAVKPQQEIYEHVIQNIPFNANECLYFDDLQENLDGAKPFGFHTQIVTKERGILELFAETIVY